jgi:hypothetical protein
MLRFILEKLSAFFGEISCYDDGFAGWLGLF